MKPFEFHDRFVNRHIGPNSSEISEMLKSIGAKNLDELIDETIPKDIRLEEELNLTEPVTEYEFIKELKEISQKNQIFKSYIGMGYYPTITPAVIMRNIFENPGWYTQYTPYQAEISQGRLEALLNFQTMVMDLTGMEIANASLLDEGTAAAEAMIMLYHHAQSTKRNSNVFFVSENVFPQTIDVLKTRANPLGIELKIGDHESLEMTDDLFGIFVQYPDGRGEINDYTELFCSAKQKNIFTCVAADLLSLTMLKPPGEFGADAVVGSSQRFGIPMGYGGPHAAFFAAREEFKRQIPGRIIGVSIDVHGSRALRMALQTREQHIRREKATSNICTSQVLLAIMAGMYAVYHGQEGLKAIAQRIHKLTILLDMAICKLGFVQGNKNYFDTLHIHLSGESTNKLEVIKRLASSERINFNYTGNNDIGISLNETTTFDDIIQIISIFSRSAGKEFSRQDTIELTDELDYKIQHPLIRKSEFLTHPVFNSFHSETEMMRYIKSLERKDLSLTTSMISLGSCTMKLNAAAEMLGVSWAEFTDPHPFAPVEQAAGYHQLFYELGKDLCEITGFAGISFQPNSGAQGEYTGLMVIRAYHQSNGENNRNVVLIPSSAHGTNPASAVMAGMKVVVVNCNSYGDIDIPDLRKKVEENKSRLAALMVTYPSTHGVFEESIKEVCSIIHQNGGQVYMDGANMNAQVGLTSPKEIGADVCHLNLHKTFCIPHGGGGPGVGPICVAEHLLPFLPGHPVIKTGGEKAISAVASAPWGSALILTISYSYIKMMGSNGLISATKAAILNANYLKERLSSYYKVLYSGKKGRVAHELIFDLREFKASANLEVEDVAKRLMDYGFHAPTVSFPVPGTLMVEPTESESKAELDKFCDAMISIRNEIKEIEEGNADRIDNVLKNAPHTAQSTISEKWLHPYSREKAVYPAHWIVQNKFWPSVGRVNNAYGDRNLVCSCNSTTDYIEEPADK